LEKDARGGVIALVPVEIAEVDQRPGDAGGGAELAVDVEALLEQRPRVDVIALLSRKEAGGVERVGSGRAAHARLRRREELGQPLASLGEVAARSPEAPQRGAEAQAVVG